MAGSSHLRVLRREVHKLRKHFLPAKFDSTGQYQEFDRVQTHTAAFVVLVHAELETFFEAWAKEIARSSEATWQATGRFTAPLVYLLAVYSEKIGVAEKIVAGKSEDAPTRLSKEVSRVFSEFYGRIKENNGIKEVNVLRLFSPLGVPAAAFGATLLPGLDSLGELRGAHAHNAGRVVVNVLDPEIEYKRVLTILNDLAVLDGGLRTYRRRIR